MSLKRKDRITNCYCRLEIFCFFNIKGIASARDKHLSIKDNPKYNNQERYDVYVEEYNGNDFDSIINRISEIETTWLEKNGVINLDYWQDNNNNETTCISVILFNQWNREIMVGMHHHKWYMGAVSEYTNECKENMALQPSSIKPKIINICTPESSELYDYMFISKERIIILIREFLDTNNTSRDFIDCLEHPYFTINNFGSIDPRQHQSSDKQNNDNDDIIYF